MYDETMGRANLLRRRRAGSYVERSSTGHSMVRDSTRPTMNRYQPARSRVQAVRCGLWRRRRSSGRACLDSPTTTSRQMERVGSSRARQTTARSDVVLSVHRRCATTVSSTLPITEKMWATQQEANFRRAWTSLSRLTMRFCQLDVSS